VSAELVVLDNGTMWVIDSHPDGYVARPVGPAITQPYLRKYELRRALHHHEIEADQ
jgi:hypothetical protein